MIKKAKFQHMEAEFYAFHDTKKEINKIRLEIMHSSNSNDENVGASRSTVISKPTERIATALTTDKRLLHLEKIIDVIESIYNALPEDEQRLVRLKYWTKPQTRTWAGIAQELNVNRATAFRWRDKIINTAIEMIGW